MYLHFKFTCIFTLVQAGFNFIQGKDMLAYDVHGNLWHFYPSDNVVPLMILFWWWRSSDSDVLLILFKWNCCFSVDVVLMITLYLWWRCFDDDLQMMFLRWRLIYSFFWYFQVSGAPPQDSSGGWGHGRSHLGCVFCPGLAHTTVTWGYGQVWWALANIQTYVYTHSNYLMMWTSLVSIGKYSDPHLHTQ